MNYFSKLSAGVVLFFTYLSMLIASHKLTKTFKEHGT